MLRQVWSRWTEALLIVKPGTVVGWRRAGLRLYWRWRSRPRGGRPRVTEEIRALIRRLAQENADWDAPKIHGELQKLGFVVSERTVAGYLRRVQRRGDPGKKWLAFLRNHREAIVAFDFFTIPTATFRVLYCFFVIEHGRRRILHFNVTRHPSTDWVVQQLREAFPEAAPYRYAILDRDSIFDASVIAFLKVTGLEPKRTSCQAPWQNGNAMHEFIAKRQEKIAGTLSGFDRLVFRGTLRSIAYREGMEQYLWTNQVLLKNFGSHVEQVSRRRLNESSLAEAETLGRPVKYLASSEVSKEDLARGIATGNGIRDGLVCVLSCVEPRWSFEIHHSRQNRRLQLEPRYRKCLFLYHYWMHPRFGFLNASIQTWFPFPVQICPNGWEWLARLMDAARLEYVRQDNRFPWIADWAKAQRLMERLKAHWPKWLDSIARQLNPIHRQIFQRVRSLTTGRPIKASGHRHFFSRGGGFCGGCARAWGITA